MRRPEREAPHDHASHDGDGEDSESHADQADVQAHVTVQYMAELVGNHALQFFAGQLVEATTGNGNGRIGRGVARGEGIDRRLVFHHENFRRRNTRGNGDFLDDIAQALVGELLGRGMNRGASQLPCNHRPTTAQR